MRINHNVAALNTYSRLAQANSATSKSLEKLSSGLRINRAGDDAAGLAISEKMRNQIKGLDQASRNAQDGISMIQTAEGALNETHAMLQRMRELTVQANNDTNTDTDRARIQDEVAQLQTEITSIGNKTEFNTKKLIDGTLGVGLKDGTVTIASLNAKGMSVQLSGVAAGSEIDFAVSGTDTVKVTVGSTTQVITGITDTTSMKTGNTLNFSNVGVTINFAANTDISTLFNGTTLNTSGAAAVFQIGANSNQTLNVNINDMRANVIGGGTGVVSDINVADTTQAFATRLTILDGAISTVSAERSKLGAWQNRLEHTINNLGTSSENLTAAESRVRDVDMAKEMMEFTKNNILTQASTAMLAQANQQPQGVLQLLR